MLSLFVSLYRYVVSIRWFFGLFSMSMRLNILKFRNVISMVVYSKVGCIIGRFMLSVIDSGDVFVICVVFFMFELRLCSVDEIYRYMCGMCVRLVMMMMFVNEYMF